MWRDWLTDRSDRDEEETPEARQKRLRRLRRWIVAGGVVLMLLVAGGVVAYRLGGRWIEKRNQQNIRSYLEQQDYRRAQLALEQAVQVSPHSLTAHRALAEFYDAANSGIAVDRWREVVALAPDDDEPKLKLASAALRLEGVEPARTALKDVSPDGKKLLGYHQVAAGIALAEGKSDELQEQLTAMAALEPDNQRTKVALATLRLRSSDPQVAQTARGELEQIARGENLRIHATLALLAALPPANNDTLLREQASRILPAVALRSGLPVEFALIEHMKAEPHPSVDDAAALTNWMIMHGQPREALVWLATQGAAVLRSPPVLVARANAAARLRDWNLLRQLVEEGAWGKVSPDAVELAFAARLQRERAGVANAKETFSDAIEVASASLPTLRALDRLCGLWGWPEESERVLTRIVRDFPREQTAWRALLAKAEGAEKSSRYLEIARRQAEAFPSDAGAQALRVYAAVVTGQSDAETRKTAIAALARDDARAEELAAGLRLRWQEKSAADALAALTPRQIETLSQNPKGSLMYGAVLTAAGKPVPAVVSRLGSPRLPEERELFSKPAAK